MGSRAYRLGKRQASVDRTHARILQAARQLIGAGSEPSVGAIARLAGVSRITVYNRFSSRSGLLAAISPPTEPSTLNETLPAPEQLRQYILHRCSAWASAPSLHRNLARASVAVDDEMARILAERLAAGDEMRAGCSLKEAEDVIGVLTSFATFDRLHHDGRRSVTAVAEILMRLASGILAYHP